MRRMQSSQRGFTLIEIMVALAIGLVVIGAVFVNYLNSSAGSRQTAALAQVTDDGAVALGILRHHIAMADFSQPIAVTSIGMTRRLNGVNVLGCQGGFTNAREPSSEAVTCANAVDSSDALLVRYEADPDMVPTVQDSSGNTVPMDCKGFGLTATTNASGTFFVSDSRFFINTDNATLSCTGNGGMDAADTSLPTSLPLVENIEDMRLTYGVAAFDISRQRPGNIVRYVPANLVAVPPAINWQAGWSNVVAVRICVLVRSVDNVLDKARPYRNCAGTVVSPAETDRRIHRAFTSTVVLNNRTGVAPAPPPAAP